MEESDRRIDSDHLVIVREIGVEITIEGEGNWRCIKRLVRLCLVLNGLACQPSQQLVDISNTLDRTQRVTVPSTDISVKVKSKKASTYPVL